MRIYEYLRASTIEQDAERAAGALQSFLEQRGLKSSGQFIENVSGASLKRPELFRLLELAQEGDVLLVEQVDRISRLSGEDWERLKRRIAEKGILIVALDAPTTWSVFEGEGDEFTSRMKQAFSAMLLDVLAATARQQYSDGRRRQAEGIAAARKDGKYRGRQFNEALHEKIRMMLQDGWSYRKIHKVLGCGHGTISTVRKRFSIPVVEESRGARPRLEQGADVDGVSRTE